MENYDQIQMNMETWNRSLTMWSFRKASSMCNVIIMLVNQIFTFFSNARAAGHVNTLLIVHFCGPGHGNKSNLIQSVTVSRIVKVV